MPWTEADDARISEFCKTVDVGALTECPKCGMGSGGKSEMMLSFFCTHKYCPFREWKQAKEAADRASVPSGTLPAPAPPQSRGANMTDLEKTAREFANRLPLSMYPDMRQAFEADILAALRFVASAPAGWRLVPEEPTEEMKEAGAFTLRTTLFGSREAAASWTYQAMLASASPSPPPARSEPPGWRQALEVARGYIVSIGPAHPSARAILSDIDRVLAVPARSEADIRAEAFEEAARIADDHAQWLTPDAAFAAKRTQEAAEMNDQASVARGLAETIRARASSLPANGWRPISEAKHDGTEYLVIWHDNDTQMVVSWDAETEGWATADGPRYNHDAFRAFMPLPAPPTGETR